MHKRFLVSFFLLLFFFLGLGSMSRVSAEPIIHYNKSMARTSDGRSILNSPNFVCGGQAITGDACNKLWTGSGSMTTACDTNQTCKAASAWASDYPDLANALNQPGTKGQVLCRLTKTGNGASYFFVDGTGYCVNGFLESIAQDQTCTIEPANQKALSNYRVYVNTHCKWQNSGCYAQLSGGACPTSTITPQNQATTCAPGQVAVVAEEVKWKCNYNPTGQCDNNGTCYVYKCGTPTETTCTSNSQCGSGQCCVSGVCKAASSISWSSMNQTDADKCRCRLVYGGALANRYALYADGSAAPGALNEGSAIGWAQSAFQTKINDICPADASGNKTAAKPIYGYGSNGLVCYAECSTTAITGSCAAAGYGSRQVAKANTKAEGETAATQTCASAGSTVKAGAAWIANDGSGNASLPGELCYECNNTGIPQGQVCADAGFTTAAGYKYKRGTQYAAKAAAETECKAQFGGSPNAKATGQYVVSADGTTGEYCYKCECGETYIDSDWCLQGADAEYDDQCGRTGGDKCSVFNPVPGNSSFKNMTRNGNSSYTAKTRSQIATQWRSGARSYISYLPSNTTDGGPNGFCVGCNESCDNGAGWYNSKTDVATSAECSDMQWSSKVGEKRSDYCSSSCGGDGRYAGSTWGTRTCSQNKPYTDSCNWLDEACLQSSDASCVDGERDDDTGTCSRHNEPNTTYHNADHTNGCGSITRCDRKLEWNVTKSGGDNTCGEGESFQMVFNKGENAECEWETVVTDGGGNSTHYFNPCACKVEYYTTDVEILDQNKNPISEFEYNSETQQCEAKWYYNPDHDNVSGRGSGWGNAARNGHWVLGAGNAASAGWEFNQRTCQFECHGDAQGANCYGKEALAPEVRFVPDLRTVVYKDTDYVSQVNASGKCAPAGSTSEVLTSGEQILADQDVDFTFTVGGSNLFEGSIKPFLNSQGYFSRMFVGENLVGKGQFSSINRIINRYDAADDADYWSCVCPTAAGGAENCQVTSANQTDLDICTTQRIYIGKRDCFNTAWWQVSGGNVYAYNDIKDSVPGNVTGVGCKDAEICLDTQPAPATGYIQDFNNGANGNSNGSGRPNVWAGQVDGYEEYLANINSGDDSCTPRIIRGRTPCKVDGPSNSAGFALTQTGAVSAANTRDCRLTGDCSDNATGNNLQTQLLQRITERANIHALSEGPNYGNNASNKSGLQAKIGYSKVAPGNSTNTQLGFVPLREDWAYFTALAGGEENLKKTKLPAGSGGQPTAFDLTRDLSRCQKVYSADGSGGLDIEPNLKSSEGATEVYNCYVDGDLTISADTQWHIKPVNNVRQKITVFVNGNLYLKGNDSDEMVVAVDVGNFLSFVVKGDIDMDAKVGVTLPNPLTTADYDKCWEGQSATIQGAYGGRQGASAVGSVEGIYIANGNLSIHAYENLDCTTVFADKRFIGQGSFIVWGQIDMPREFNSRDRGCQDDTYGVYNNRVPTETFIYRPDLVRNLPYWMRRSSVFYQEI